MNEKNKRILIIAIISFFALALVVGIVSPIVLLGEVNKTFENDAKLYFAGNKKLDEELGTIYEYKCLGRASKRDSDGLPVSFEVKAEKGEYYVILWFETICYDPIEREVVKHLVTTTIPDDIV